MTKISDQSFDNGALMDELASDPSTPDTGTWRLYPKSDGIYAIDDAGTVVGPFAESAGNAGLTGNQIVAIPFGVDHAGTSTGGTGGAAYALPVVIAGTMKVRAWWVRVNTGGSGTCQWGLFDYSSNPAAATKLAGGSGALSSTGWQSIAATSAPVSVSPGCYMLVLHLPASNAPNLFYNNGNTAGYVKFFGSYVWDDTPDFTSVSWTDTSGPWSQYLEGDMDGSETRW